MGGRLQFISARPFCNNTRHLIVLPREVFHLGIKETALELILLKLTSALNASGYPVDVKDDRLIPLATKLVLLQYTGRYSKLLSDLFSANNKANLQSLILEATFAFQFEKVGKLLNYEVRKRSDNETTIDFCRVCPTGRNIYIEMRLVHQRQWITDHFKQQLEHSDYFGITLDGNEDRAETVRLQRLILSKVQDENGRLIKFLRDDSNSYNIVAVEVSEPHLGMTDHADCLLATYGDPAVSVFERRKLFGLFQEDNPKYPQHIHDIADKFREFRATMHAVLFLWKEPPASPVNFEIEFFLVQNKTLISADEAIEIAKDLNGALAIRGSKNKTLAF